MVKLSSEKKWKLLNRVPAWWHKIDLGDGVVTPGKTSLETQRKLLSAIPENLIGKRVLDVGAWDGIYSFECEKRGAKVSAIDIQPGHGFLTARRILRSKAKYYRMSVFDIPSKFKRPFDIILFFGVLYHLKNPLEALEILSSKTRQLLVLETHCPQEGGDVPVMKFYPGNELNNDYTNWWGPNIQCLKEMLKVAGFKKIDIIKGYGKGSRILMTAHK